MVKLHLEVMQQSTNICPGTAKVDLCRFGPFDLFHLQLLKNIIPSKVCFNKINSKSISIFVSISAFCSYIWPFCLFLGIGPFGCDHGYIF